MKQRMTKESKIKNLDDLRAEIARLKMLAGEQEQYLSDQYRLFNNKVEAAARFFKSLFSRLSGADDAKGLFDQREQGVDWVSKALWIGLPVVLNRLLLRNAGLLKRAIVTILSQHAAGSLNKENVRSPITNLADFVRPS